MKKEPWLWTKEDLLQLIDLSVQESLELDFKRCDALQNKDKKKNEISKDVSAFANAAGGTIIYGMIEDGHVPTSLDIGFNPNEISKEWLEQVINSRVHRRINGIRINQVNLNETDSNQVIYVVYIPQSNQAPHQASDKRFYKRSNFESVPMEEYEIRDTANRDTSPDLELNFLFTHSEIEKDLKMDGEEYYYPIELIAAVNNMSQTVALHAVFHLYIDDQIIIEDIPDEVKVHGKNDNDIIKLEKQDIELIKLTIIWDNNKGLPLFKGVTVNIPTPSLKLRIPQNIKQFLFRYTIGAPSMEVKDEYILMSVIDNVAKLKSLPIVKGNNA